jgi:hypothetical protein
MDRVSKELVMSWHPGFGKAHVKGDYHGSRLRQNVSEAGMV